MERHNASTLRWFMRNCRKQALTVRTRLLVKWRCYASYPFEILPTPRLSLTCPCTAP